MNQNNTSKLTGYPSIDMPWRHYYAEEAYTAPLPKGSLYDMLYAENADRPNALAIHYFKTKITVGQLFQRIDAAARAFLELGVKKGDIVTLALPNIPECVYCIYGLNRIGAIANLIDLRLSGEKLVDAIKKVESKIVAISDLFVENAVAVQDQLQVKNWLVLSPFDSFSQPLQAILKYKNRKPAMKKLENRMLWAAFLKMGEKSQAEIPASGDAGAAACIFHTSGTTLAPKGVMLTNQNMNALALEEQFSRTPILENETFLSNIPPFLAYNTCFMMHMPLVLKLTVIMVPACPAEKFVDLVMEKKPNHVAGGAASWRAFSKNPKTREFDFSFLRIMCSGNDKLEQEVKDEVNALLRKGGCKSEITEGYGMTEAGSAVACCWHDINSNNTIGIPMCRNIISIFDPDEPERELTYGERGEICICGPSVMAGYYKDPETTAEVLRTHKDGRVWLHSGDLGHMDEKGWLYFDGRIKRTIVRSTGYKVAPLEFEQLIQSHENVQACCVVGKPDKIHGKGQVPVAYMVLKDPSRDPSEELREKIEKSYPDTYWIDEFVVIEKLPMTANEKVDYRALEKA